MTDEQLQGLFSGLERFVAKRLDDVDARFNDTNQRIDKLDLRIDETNARIEKVETTLLIHQQSLLTFPDYNDFLPEVDRLVRKLGLEGVIQVASFHPDYQFAGTAPDAVENYTNRSPYPMLHLLREESITEVAGDQDALAAIPLRNILTLRGLGRAEMMARLQAVTGPAN